MSNRSSTQSGKKAPFVVSKPVQKKAAARMAAGPKVPAKLPPLKVVKQPAAKPAAKAAEQKADLFEAPQAPKFPVPPVVRPDASGSERLSVAEFRALITDFTGTKFILMTPELVEEMLSRNSGNRRLSQQRSESYAGMMEEGRWRVTGEPLIMSKQGILNTGQHRLRAMQIYGRALPFYVCFGVDREAFQVTDTGRSHNSADVLSTMGIPSAAFTSAIARLIILYEKGLPTAANRALSPDLIVAAIQRWPQIAQAASMVNGMKWPQGFKTAPLGALAFFGIRTEGEAVTRDFLKLTATGLTNDENDPARRLYSRLLNETGRTKIDQIERLALGIKALNAFRKNEKITNLRWRSQGPAAEGFPSVDGLRL